MTIAGKPRRAGVFVEIAAIWPFVDSVTQHEVSLLHLLCVDRHTWPCRQESHYCHLSKGYVTIAGKHRRAGVFVEIAAILHLWSP